MTATKDNERYQRAKRRNLFDEDPDTLIIAGLDAEGPRWLTNTFRNNLPVSQSLVDSLKVVGQITEPISTVRIGSQDFVAKGRQRTRAVRQYNLELKEKLEAGEVPMDDIRVAKAVAAGVEPTFENLRMLIPVVRCKGRPESIIAIDVASNHHAQAVSPVQRAWNFQDYLEAGGQRDELSALTGLSEAAISQHLQLLGLAPEVLDLVDAGLLSKDAALELRDKTYAEQKALAEEVRTKGEKVTKREVRKSTSSRPTTPKKRYIKKLLKAPPASWSKETIKVIRWMLGELPPEEAGIDGTELQVHLEVGQSWEDSAGKLYRINADADKPLVSCSVRKRVSRRKRKAAIKPVPREAFLDMTLLEDQEAPEPEPETQENVSAETKADRAED